MVCLRQHAGAHVAQPSAATSRTSDASDAGVRDVKPDSLQGTLAVVTGGASGIGYALANAFGQRGASVLIADRDESALGLAHASLSDAGVETHTHLVDLCDAAAVIALAERATSIAPISAACLNAGVSGGGWNIWETPDAAFEFAFDVNLWALLNSMRALVPVLIAQNRPADVVVTTSLAGLISLPVTSSYTVSKAAATAATRVLRAELALVAPKVRVACLAPAMVRTNLAHSTAAQQPETLQRDAELTDQVHSAMNTLGATPDEVAQWVLDALDRGRFWVLSPPENEFMRMLASELEELNNAMDTATA
jgi:NAD(P)-dependent dehydrogenase (short-subunit alcohol dehydrogenase family)